MAWKGMRRWCHIRVEVLISNVSAAPATSGAAPAAAAEVIFKGPFCNNIGYVAKNIPQNSITMSSYIQAEREEDDDMAFRLLRPQWLTCGFEQIYFQPHLWCAKLFMDKYIYFKINFQSCATLQFYASSAQFTCNLCNNKVICYSRYCSMSSMVHIMYKIIVVVSNVK